MSHPVPISRLAREVALLISRAFDRFQEEFRAITRRAPQRFAERSWRGLQADRAERLDVYDETLGRVVPEVENVLGEHVQSRLAWIGAKSAYSALIHQRDDWEIAETFFNSVTRRIFTTVGVDAEIEFVHTDYESPPTRPRHPPFASYEGNDDLSEMLGGILRDFPLLPDSPSRRQASEAAAEKLEPRLRQYGGTAGVECIDMLQTVFYRGEYAFLVGRVHTVGGLLPLVLCFRHPPEGVALDEVLTATNDVSLLFSFARNYFQVDVDRPYDLVRFIKSIIPRKPTAEIYISLGYNKHGKTELYRHALRHLARSSDKYQLAAGQRGMVMTVFTMPSYPVVFKIIKDRFDYPKECTRQDVIDRYRMVFKHDRAGRLIDAQEYKYLVLDRDRFDDDLVEELLNVASRAVCVRGDKVVIKHCYAERRVVPLDVYLRQVGKAAARAAVVDYGQTIKDLALTNIFPGDLLLKNFGVTRQKRVVFYDYDEICLLTDCNFRSLPEASDYQQEMSAEPWFAVGRDDVFPEEFQYFLGLPAPLRSLFEEHHNELFTVDFWRNLKRRIEAGEIFHVVPYYSCNVAAPH